MLIYRSLTLSAVREIDSTLSGSSSSLFAMIDDMPSYEFIRLKFGTGGLRLGTFQIPYIFFLFIAVTVLFIFVMSYTKYGKSVYAVGSNEKAARPRRASGLRYSGSKIMRPLRFLAKPL